MRSYSRTASPRRLGLVIQALVAVQILVPTVSARAEPGALVPAAEAEGSPKSLKVTWQDIVRLVDQHPRLAAAEFGMAAAEGAATAARTLPNPSLDATLSRGEARKGSQSRIERGLAITFPLEWVVKRGYQVDAATAEVEATRQEARAIRRNVLLQLRVLFWNLAYEQAHVAALEDLDRQTAHLVRSIKRRVETGEVRPSEQTRVEVEFEKATSELDTARSSLRARQEQLKLWIAGADGEQLAVEADISSVPRALDLNTARAEARARHPSIEAARARVQALTSTVGVEKMSRFPSLAIKGFTADELDRRAFGGGLAIDLPLWNWNSGRIAEARARLAAGEKQLEYETREIESSIIDAQGACLAASQTAVRYKDRILPRSESAASTMEKTYQLGEASLLEVIDARRVLVDTRRQYLAALLQAQLECSRLNDLAGKEDE